MLVTDFLKSDIELVGEKLRSLLRDVFVLSTYRVSGETSSMGLSDESTRLAALVSVGYSVKKEKANLRFLGQSTSPGRLIGDLKLKKVNCRSKRLK